MIPGRSRPRDRAFSAIIWSSLKPIPSPACPNLRLFHGHGDGLGFLLSPVSFYRCGGCWSVVHCTWLAVLPFLCQLRGDMRGFAGNNPNFFLQRLHSKLALPRPHQLGLFCVTSISENKSECFASIGVEHA